MQEQNNCLTADFCALKILFDPWTMQERCHWDPGFQILLTSKFIVRVFMTLCSVNAFYATQTTLRLMELYQTMCWHRNKHHDHLASIPLSVNSVKIALNKSRWISWLFMEFLTWQVPERQWCIELFKSYHLVSRFMLHS